MALTGATPYRKPQATPAACAVSGKSDPSDKSDKSDRSDESDESDFGAGDFGRGG